MPRLAGVLVLLFLAPGLALAQPADSSTTIAEVCADSSFRAFDFWIGGWVVRDSAGTRVGTSRISRRAHGCSILEEWSGGDGSRGTSLNYYDPAAGTWRQDWVGSSGTILHLSGGLDGDAMVMEGPRPGTDEPVRDRIRWTPLDDGRVRQEWTASSDGGNTWRRVFLGFYSPAPADEAP